MATITNPFVTVNRKRAAGRCSTLLTWPREHLPALWQKLVTDLRGPSRPTCPDCGSAMILRKVKYGPDVGKEFWDCSNYFQCSAKMDSDTAMLRANKSPFAA